MFKYGTREQETLTMATMAQNGKVVLQHLLQTLITLGAILQAANALPTQVIMICFSSNKYTPIVTNFLLKYGGARLQRIKLYSIFKLRIQKLFKC